VGPTAGLDILVTSKVSCPCRGKNPEFILQTTALFGTYNLLILNVVEYKVTTGV